MLRSRTVTFGLAPAMAIAVVFSACGSQVDNGTGKPDGGLSGDLAASADPPSSSTLPTSREPAPGLVAPPAPSGDTKGSITFHIAFPSAQGDSYEVTPTQVDLLMSEVIAGAMLGRLLAEHRQLQNQKALSLNRDYLYGTLIAQLLQENLQPDYKDALQNWIDSDASQRAIMLSAGQGGPYQLNDYSKRLESGFGLVNFVALQGGLGFSVVDQDSGAQTRRIGPESLENKYFGPMAAAYFHYNDWLRVEILSSGAWYQPGPDTKACFGQIDAGTFDYLDMVLNAIYNAGSFSSTYEGYVSLCAHAADPAYASKLSAINDYTLSDAAYTAATGINSSGTFVLYPRQIRNYLDQLYNIDTHILPVGNVVLKFDIPNLRYVFEVALGTLGIADLRAGTWRLISGAEAATAFDSALERAGIASGAALYVNVAADRAKLFDLLDAALATLAQTLGINFTATAEANLAIGETSGGTGPCPTDAPVYPSGRGSYATGTVVKASDQRLYRCKEAGWCNSTAESYYSPATGSNSGDAWAPFECQ